MSAVQQAVGAHDREIANGARLGTVREVRTSPEALARVDTGELATDWYPWTAKAGEDSDWWVPSVGEQVVVLMLHGDVSQGVIIGSVYCDKFPEPSNRADVWMKLFSDGTRFTYDRAAHTLEVDTKDVGGITIICKTANVQAKESITFDTPKAKFTGDVEVDGNSEVKGDSKVDGSTAVKAITSNGVDIGSTHTHPGVQSGGSKTLPPG